MLGLKLNATERLVIEDIVFDNLSKKENFDPKEMANALAISTIREPVLFRLSENETDLECAILALEPHYLQHLHICNALVALLYMNEQCEKALQVGERSLELPLTQMICQGIKKGMSPDVLKSVFEKFGIDKLRTGEELN